MDKNTVVACLAVFVLMCFALCFVGVTIETRLREIRDILKERKDKL